jgi:serine/threonine protein kinase
MAERRPEWKKGSSSIPKQVFHEVPETLETLKARVRKIFDLFDTDQNGFLDATEFQELAYALGETISKEEAQRYVNELDTNKDGQVSFDEFFAWWQKQDMTSSQHKPTGLAVLKLRLQSQPLMKSVSNLMGKLKEKHETEKRSAEEGCVDIKISAGDLDKAPASLVLNYTKIPLLEGLPVVGVTFLTKPHPDMNLLDQIKANFTRVLTGTQEMRELFLHPQYYLQSADNNRFTFTVELPFSPQNPATMLLGMGLEIIQINHLSTGIRVSQRVSELSINNPLCAEFFFKLSAPRNVVRIVTEQVQTQVPLQKPLQSGMSGLHGFKSFVLHVEFDDMSEFFRTLVPANVPKESLSVEGLKSLLAGFLAKGLESTGANPDLELHFREAVFDSIDFLDEWKSLYLRVGQHQFSLDCTGLDLFKILPNRQVLNYPRQVSASASFSEKYRVTGESAPVANSLEGEVWLVAESVKDQTPVLVRRVDKHENISEEVALFRGLQHPNLLRFIDSVSDDEYHYMIFAHETGFTQLDAALSLKRFSESEGSHIIKQLVALIDFLHSKKIASRDIRPEAFIYNQMNGTIKLITLKNAAQTLPITDNRGSNSYSAPEVFFETEYDMACDMWSLGALAYHLLTGHYPFPGEKVAEVLQHIRTFKYNKTSNEWRTLSKNAQNFIGRLFQPRKQRATIAQIKAHTWLTTAK